MQEEHLAPKSPITRCFIFNSIYCAYVLEVCEEQRGCAEPYAFKFKCRQMAGTPKWMRLTVSLKRSAAVREPAGSCLAGRRQMLPKSASAKTQMRPAKGTFGRAFCKGTGRGWWRSLKASCRSKLRRLPRKRPESAPLPFL